MNKLWLLHLDYVHLSSGFDHILRRLLWLSWNGCPLVWLPSKLYIDKLVALDLRHSKLKQVWKGSKDLNNLKFLYLSHCYYLTETPNFSGLNNLEELLIDNCIRLVEIDKSIGCLNKLIVLDMANCKKLEKFPSRILMLKSLEYLDLLGCSKLREFAGFKGSLSKSLYTFFSSRALPRKNVDSIGFSLQGLRSLKTLKIANVNMSYLPSEIGSLVTLTDLDLSKNEFLCTLPDSIYNLTRLQRLNMAICNVSNLSSEIGNLVSLTNLNLTGNDLCALPDSIGNLTRLKSLYMEGCNVSYLPSEIGSLISLRVLDLAENNLCSLPDSIGNLTCLTVLGMINCNVSYLPSEIGSLISLTSLFLCENNLCKLPDSIGNLTRLEELFLGGNNLCKLPDSIGNLTRLEGLLLDENNLCKLPNSIGKLTCLNELRLDGNNLCTLPDSVSNLHRLHTLGLNNCNLSHLPSAILDLLMWLSLEYLYLKGCHKLAESNFVNNVMKAAIWRVKGFRARKNHVIPTFQEFRAGKSHAIHGFVDHFVILLTWGEVPRWFEYQTEGSYLSVKVPPLINQEIWSLAVCVIYIGSNSNENCKQTVSFRLEYHINKVQKRSCFILDSDNDFCSEDQMCLKFTSSMSELECGDEVEIFITECEDIQVKKCAAKLIFEDDEDTDDEDTDDEALADYI